MQHALEVLGAEIREARLAANMTQESLADVLGWGKDAVSKLERGLLDIKLRDYLTLVSTLALFLPRDHPGRALVEHVRFRSLQRRK